MHVVTTPDRTSLASLATSALAVVVALPIVGSSWGATGVMIGVTLGVAVVAAVIDARRARIPNSLVLIAAAPSLVLVAVAAADGRAIEALADIALGGLLFAGPLFVMHLISPDALGFGDVKLAAVLGAALGAVEPRLGVLALCLAAGSAAAIGLIGRRDSVPFAPGLVLGAVVALLAGTIVGEGALAWH